MRSLLVSSLFPRTDATFGGWKRLLLFARALKDLGTLDAVFMLSSDRLADGAVGHYQERLKQDLGGGVTATFCSYPAPSNPATSWELYGSGLLSVWRRPDMRRFRAASIVRSLTHILSRHRYDVVFAAELFALAPLLDRGVTSAPLVVDLNDIEHVRYSRELRQPPFWRGKPLLYAQIPAAIASERNAAARAASSFVCSAADANYLRVWGYPRVAVVPNAVSFPSRGSAVSDEPVILFVGQLSYPPNTYGLDWFARDIWPLIRAKVPNASLRVVGGNPEFTETAHNCPDGIVFTGFVRDLSAEYARAAVVCCPIRSGAGTRVKLVEAASYSKPMVSTRIGAEGLIFEDGRHILIRDRHIDFADACVRLLRNPDEARRLGHAAYEAAAVIYEESSVMRTIQKHILDVTATHRQ